MKLNIFFINTLLVQDYLKSKKWCVLDADATRQITFLCQTFHDVAKQP